jgi:hypothetical protein
MRERRQRWRNIYENDPLAGLINLFDLWMVFSVALLISLLSYWHWPNGMQNDGHNSDAAQTAEAIGASSAESPAIKNLEPINAKAQVLERYRVSQDDLTGEGERLGTAYRLKSGEVVYVPDGGKSR